MNLLPKIIKKMDVVLQRLLVTIMILLVLDVTWQVLTRFILTQPSSFTEEVARFLLIWMSLLGGAYAYYHNMHLGFDLIVKKLSPPVATVTYRFCLLLVAIFAVAVLIVGGINLVLLTWSLGQHSPVLNVPMAFIYLVLPLSGGLFLLYSINFFFSTFTHLNDGEK